MVGTASSRDVALLIARALVDHRAEHTVVLDVGDQSGWTDFFVIATTTSDAHLRGLLGYIRRALQELRRAPASTSRRPRDESGWALVDLGDVVVHLMNEAQRDFYELERLWFRSPVVFEGELQSSSSIS